MRVFLLVPLFLAGCASLPAGLSPGAATELAASLSFVAGDRPLEPNSGIESVGDYFFPRVGVKFVQLAPGLRVIGYSCPGYVTVDGPMTVSYTFEGASQYEIYCQKGVAIVRVKAQ